MSKEVMEIVFKQTVTIVVIRSKRRIMSKQHEVLKLLKEYVECLNQREQKLGDECLEAGAERMTKEGNI